MTHEIESDPAGSQLAAAMTDAAGDEERSRIEVLFDRMLDSADLEGLVDVAYRVVDSPFGPLLIAATSAGVVRVAFAVQGHDQVLEDLAARVSPRIVHLPRRLDTAAAELDEYFHGARAAFTVPVDLRLTSGFRRAVLERLTSIPYGGTAGYAQIASAAGNAGAARAAGSACARNPIPILVPCHRVVRSDGSLGGYVGGPAAKSRLLEIESRADVAPPQSGESTSDSPGESGTSKEDAS